MDRNTLLAFALSMLVFTAWLAWQAENAPKREALGPIRAIEEEQASATRSPQAFSTPQHEAQQTQTGIAPTSPTPRAAIPAPVGMDPQPVAWSREFETELYTAELTNRGAAFSHWTLKSYDERTDAGVRPMQLLQLEEPHNLALVTPFVELGFGDLSHAVYEVESESSESVSFVLRRGDVVIWKVYEFDREGYGFQVVLELENRGSQSVSPKFEIVWPAAANKGNDFTDQSLATFHAGDLERTPVAGVGRPGFFDGFFDGGETEGENGSSIYRGEIDWAGVDTKYFISALLPERTRNAIVQFVPLELDRIGAAVLGFAASEIPPGQSVRHRYRGYVGPKEPERLDDVGQGLSHSINLGYSWIAPLTRFFTWLLAACYSVIPNYGLAIIVITILVRVVTLPIVSRQMKSMERMRALQPQLKELQEKHKDDRAKQSEEMMKLYRRTGVNPLGGCLPMLLQFPVFIGLFFALQSSIDLRHAPFMLWISDLSAPESLFTLPGLELPVRLLPIIMGASMVLQQKFTPMTVDPAQARMMLIMMPAMMTVLFYQFPSGLVLYWMISNLLGIGHQMFVGRRMRAAESS